MTTLTQANPAKTFTGQAGTLKRIATSGVTDGATIKLQHKVVETDDWVDYPHLTFDADTHLSGFLSITAPFNRLVVDAPTANTSVNIVL